MRARSPASWLELELGHELLLGKHVPAGLGAVQPGQQPASLLGPEQRAPWIQPLGAAGDELPAADAVVVTGLVVAVLAGVQHRHLGQVTEPQSPVQPRRRPLGAAAPPQGQVLPVGLVGGGAAAAERRRRVEAFGLVGGVVVLDLVVIPGHHERQRGMGRLEIGVGAVQGVAQPVAG
jgi:hypothetical protein